jgi:hypothetical protein
MRWRRKSIYTSDLSKSQIRSPTYRSRKWDERPRHPFMRRMRCRVTAASCFQFPHAVPVLSNRTDEHAPRSRLTLAQVASLGENHIA